MDEVNVKKKKKMEKSDTAAGVVLSRVLIIKVSK